MPHIMKLLYFSTLLLLVAPLACHHAGSQTSPGVTTSVPYAAQQMRQITLDTGTVSGLSGLTLDRAGEFWAVSERDRVVLTFDLDNGAVAQQSDSIPLTGVADDLDTESIAMIGPNRFAFGTETHEAEQCDDVILFAELQKDKIVVTDQITLPYSLWDTVRPKNQGIEGLCADDGQLVAGVEAVLNRNGQRIAPIARYDLETHTFTPYQLALTTETGRISGLFCRMLEDAPDTLEVLAIERHHGTSRLLQFNLPISALASDADDTQNIIEPRIILDMVAVLPKDHLPNFEGVVRRRDGTLVLLSDNHTHSITGPTEILVVPRAAK